MEYCRIYKKKITFVKKTFKAFDNFPFVHLIVNYVTLSFKQSLHGVNFKYPDS